VELLREHRWRHPGDEAVQALVPFLQEPIDLRRDLLAHGEAVCLQVGVGAGRLVVPVQQRQVWHLLGRARSPVLFRHGGRPGHRQGLNAIAPKSGRLGKIKGEGRRALPPRLALPLAEEDFS
jgi:hypothetical protein